MTDTPTYGIDLGTTCSAIGRVVEGRPRLVAVRGAELVPSVVCFIAGKDPLVGEPAANRMALDPERTIRSAKRHIGSGHRWFVDELEVSPVEVASLVLRELARGVEEATGARPERVVITVPAWFNQAQRGDTREAARMADLEPVRIINEPTAAALAHAHGRDLRRRALVYDLGGGTFDCSLVEQDGAVVEVLASHGDTRLGGDDVDAALVERVLERLAGEDAALAAAAAASAPARVRLRLAVELAKIELSSSLEATLRVPFLMDLDGRQRHVELRLERAEVEAAAEALIERSFASVDQVLEDARARDGDLELLLVGGATRMPIVWQRLRERYGLEGSAAIPPDRAVALGAAIQAAIVDGSRVDGVLVDVAPYSLSVGALSGEYGRPRHYTCRVVTPRNSPLPARHAEVFYTTDPIQPRVDIPVFQGGDPNPLRNVALGEIVMRGLPPAPAGRQNRPLHVEFRHDLDGMVSIRVTDALSGRSVDSRVAADGMEVSELRERLAEHLAEDGLIPGDGSDPDPWLELEPERGGDERAEAAGAAATELDVEAARRTFTSLLEKGRDWSGHDRARVERMRQLARDGLADLEAGAEARAGERYDELSDLLFEEGVYL